MTLMMHYFYLYSIFILLSWLSLLSTAFAEGFLSTPVGIRNLQVQSWQERRDEGIVKQKHDYSCGAASLATILRSFYNQDISEQDILDALETDDEVSFANLRDVMPRFGVKGVGLALDIKQLEKVKIPVIVYLDYHGDDHFSVLRGINKSGVLLADPSWGNRRYSTRQFQEMWETRTDQNLPGKVLLVLPLSGAINEANPDFFINPVNLSLPLERIIRRR